MTRTVEDAAILLRSMAGHDVKDSTSLAVETPDFASFVGKSVKGLRIGVPKEYRVDNMPAEVDALWEQGIAWLKDAGCEIVEVSLPHTKYALPAYYIIAPAEASSNLARYDGMRYGLRVEGANLLETYEQTRAAGFGDEVKRRIMIGAYVLSAGYYDAYYLKALKVRRRIADDFDRAFEKVDALLTPTAPSAAFALGDRADDPVAMYLNDIFTVTVNLAGLPGMSVPAGLDAQGLPLGLQLIGRALDEGTLFSLGAAVEKAAAFRAKPQKWW
jgi:aspartyl-tRNA(Asn)/glutamyl-tRNA(Gln) amidotransferase subunit A